MIDSSMSNKEFNKDVRELLIRTKVSTLLRDRPVILLKQESTVELALQAGSLSFIIALNGLSTLSKTPTPGPLGPWPLQQSGLTRIKRTFTGHTTRAIIPLGKGMFEARAAPVGRCVTMLKPLYLVVHTGIIFFESTILLSCQRQTIGLHHSAICLNAQTLASRKILSAPVVAAPEGIDPTTFTANAEDQDIVCFVDIRDVRTPLHLVILLF